MKHILLDVNVVVDLCVERDGTANSALAIAMAESTGTSIWVYTGSVQTLEYVVAQEIYRNSQNNGILISHKESNKKAKTDLLRQTAGMQWLASLSGEGNVFGCDDPEDEQLLIALDRFPANTVGLLTRDGTMLKRAGARAITPEVFIEACKRESTQRTIEFIDLKIQQDYIRPALEENIHRVLHHG